jgi:hypothetical protein
MGEGKNEPEFPPKVLFIPKVTWWSGLPTRTLRAIEQVEAGQIPPEHAILALKAAAKRAERGECPAREVSRTWTGCMSPEDRATTARDLLVLAKKAEALCRGQAVGLLC